MDHTDYIRKLEEANKQLEENAINHQRLRVLNEKLKIVLALALNSSYQLVLEQSQKSANYKGVSRREIIESMEIEFKKIMVIFVDFTDDHLFGDLGNIQSEKFIIDQVNTIYEKLLTKT